MTGSVKKQLKQALPALIILVVILIAVSVVSPNFRKIGNIRNVIAQCAVIAVVAIAQSEVLFIGGIDMSVGSVISFSTIMMAMYGTSSVSGVFLGVGLSLGMGLLTGFVNGIGVVRLRIPAMIITISTQALLKGLCLILMPSSGGQVNPQFASVLKARVGLLNVSFLIALFLYAAMFTVMHYTRYGRNLYAIGNGEIYAEQSGIRTKRNIVGAYMVSGLLSATAGILLSARIAVGNPLVGDSYAMNSIASAVVGGISMTGGIGTVIGALFGSMILGLINNVMNNMNISPYYQYIVNGLVLVVSMLLFQLKRVNRT